MMNKKQKKQYLKLEKELNHEFRNVHENELTLLDEDFKDDGKLKSSAFARLKDECWYIPYEDEVVIKLPAKYAKNFSKRVRFLASRELSKIKKDRLEACFHGAILFATGILVLGTLSISVFFLDALSEIMFITELFTIFSWVFVWAAVSKFFIDRRETKDQRFTLLQMLSAKIILVESEK
ncbi:MAG: hypothetical protein FWE36_04160 [Erysipelotrichales bacterium]|nr:hypothetical protein [Erysipelotrichales bacterium]